MRIKFDGWPTPDHLTAELGGKILNIPLPDVDVEDLVELCVEFRKSVFAKAGKQDPELSKAIPR